MPSYVASSVTDLVVPLMVRSPVVVNCSLLPLRFVLLIAMSGSCSAARHSAVRPCGTFCYERSVTETSPRSVTPSIR